MTIEAGRIEDTNISKIIPLTPPKQFKMEIPNNSPHLVLNTRQEIVDIIHGRDVHRMLMVLGPCSIHDPQIAADYAGKLSTLKGRLEDDLVIVMRVYLEKPRTTVGWTGLVYNPLEVSEEADTGLRLSRKILSNINDSGIPCAVEVLDPITPQYLADLVSWAAVGARTTESQTHRQLASGLSMPIGFKNSTRGCIEVAAEAMVAAGHPHVYFGIDAENGRASAVYSNGNRNTHLVLRGSNNTTNYDAASIAIALDSIQKQKLLTETSRQVMIDCSHGNSAKDHTRQPHVVRDVLEQVRAGQYRVMGFMLESNLFAGKQSWTSGKSLEYGVSITDACIGWKETEEVLLNCAKMLRPRKHFFPTT